MNKLFLFLIFGMVLLVGCSSQPTTPAQQPVVPVVTEPTPVVTAPVEPVVNTTPVIPVVKSNSTIFCHTICEKYHQTSIVSSKPVNNQCFCSAYSNGTRTNYTYQVEENK